MDLPQAHQAEILRASQKDDYWSSRFCKMAVDTLSALFGPSFELKHGDKIRLVSKCLYYALSALGGRTTGEEYTSLYEEAPRSGLQNKLVRTLAYLMQVLLLDEGGWLTKWVDLKARDLVCSLHLAAFYLSSRNLYLKEGRRLFGLTYIRPERETNEEKPNYNILGLLLLVKAAILTYELAQKYLLTKKIKEQKLPEESVDLKIERGKEEEENILNEEQHTCPLCLEPVNQPTCTPCGHVFCWDCVAPWSVNNASCPLCRAEMKRQELILIPNFSSSTL